jgi:hypothetical protein
VFFVCRRNTEPGRYLWFTYLYALERFFPRSSFLFRGRTMNMSSGQRSRTVGQLRRELVALRPHPSAVYAAIENELPPLEDFISADVIDDCYAGMSADMIRAIAADPLFAVCAHTLDHPYLTLCEPSERRRQIAESAAWLTRLTSRTCTAIAYPAGDYNAAVIEDCVAAGIADGYAVSQRVGRLPRLEQARIGIYSPSIPRLAIKVSAGNALRSCIEIG